MMSGKKRRIKTSVDESSRITRSAKQPKYALESPSQAATKAKVRSVGSHAHGNSKEKKRVEEIFARFKIWLRDTGFVWDEKEIDMRATGTISAGGN